MSTVALPFFEDEDPRDLRRWAFAAGVVLAVHLAAIAGFLYVHQPDEIGDNVIAAVDFTPSDDTIDQPEVAPVPKQPQPEVEQPPPETAPVVALPEPKPVEKIEEKKPPTPAIAARTKGGAVNPVAASWQTDLVKHLQRYKRYPGDAQARGEEGVVMLAFSVDRSGHVLTRRVVQSSGHAALDDEVMSMIERAQPLPAFPPSMSEAKLDLVVPIRFSLR